LPDSLFLLGRRGCEVYVSLISNTHGDREVACEVNL
jgi:hypothetical protein